MKTLIIVPARYGSTRLPGKPLIEIAGRSMVSRVAEIAAEAAGRIIGGAHVVATDDRSIEDHCKSQGIPVVMTDPECPSGSDRALAAVEAMGVKPDIVVNLQGDAPFTPAAHVVAVAEACAAPEVDIATPVVALSWDALDRLRSHKESAPHSGTCCIRLEDGRAVWFSKTIIPTIRKETEWREKRPISPILRHIGLYAYRLDALKRFASLPPTEYERLEGLEQLRALEAGMHMQAVLVEAPEISMSGIDEPADVALAEQLIREKG